MPNQPSLQYKVVLAIALVLLTTRIGLNSLFSGNFSIIASASDITTGNLTNAVNRERTQRNIPGLAYNSKLAVAADSKARDMIARKYFAHVDPDGHYIWDKIVANGYYPYTILGENLAIDFGDTEGLVAAWIDSPTHRANLLNPSFKDQGMGVSLGDTNNGEYSVAVANTFGAQPAPNQTPQKVTTSTPPPAQPTPQSKPILKNKITLKTKSQKTPLRGTAAESTPATSFVSITNTEKLSHKNSITLTGTTNSISPIVLKDKNDSSSNSATALADQNGNFVYTFKNLANGEHTFIATVDQVTSAEYKIRVVFNPPVINEGSVKITPTISNSLLNILVSAEVLGDNLKVSVSLNDKNSELIKDSGFYSGSLSLDKYSDYQKLTLQISAEDTFGNKTTSNIPLANYPLPKTENPKTIGNIPAKAASPDLYNTFKYIVIIAGGLFILFLLGDTLHLSRGKYKDDFTRGSNIIVLFLVLSTLLLVTWWH
jgi:hypothetical protein